MLPNEKDAMFYAILTGNVELLLDGPPVKIDELDAERFDCLPETVGDGVDVYGEIYISTREHERLEMLQADWSEDGSAEFQRC